jgi:hypothetical protein
VTFGNLGNVPIAMLHGHVNVAVSTVQGEGDINNNKASYPVIFSLPGG